MASRFVMKDEVPTETFDWGSAGMRGAPPSTGCETYIVMDVELRWLIVRRLAVLDAIDESFIRAELDRDPTSSGLEHAATARASRRSARWCTPGSGSRAWASSEG